MKPTPPSPLTAFFKSELALTPSRQRATLRLFVALMLVSLVAVALKPPVLIPLDFSIIISLGAGVIAATSLKAMLDLMWGTLVVMVLSILSIALFGDQPWFLVPWVAVVVTLVLLYCRVTGAMLIPLLFFANAVLYHPLQSEANVHIALWSIPVALLACAASAFAQLALWPEEPLEALHRELLERFSIIARILERLGTIGTPAARAATPAAHERPAAGGLAKQIQLLKAALGRHPDLRDHYTARLDLIGDLDTWFSLAAWLERDWGTTQPPIELTPDQRQRFHRLAADCRRSLDLYQAMGAGVPAVEEVRLRPLPSPEDCRSRIDWRLSRLETISDRVLYDLARLYGAPAEAPIPIQPADLAPGRAELPAWLGWKFWRDHRRELKSSLKYTIGMLICLFTVQALNWPVIDTAMVTCLVIAQSSLGADFRKALLRVSGAVLGGLLAYVFIIVIQPAIDTVAGFLLGIAPAVAIAAWFGSGGPRIGYMGVQIGFAFAHVVLADFGPVTDLESARDRVLGIILGITVMGVLDQLLWPVSSIQILRGRLVTGLANIADWLQPVDGSPPRPMTMLAVDRLIAQALDILDHARFEPDSDRPQVEAERVMLGALVGDLHGCARALFRRHRLARQTPLPERLAAQRCALDAALAVELRALSAALAQPDLAIPLPGGQEEWQAMERAAREASTDATQDEAQRAAAASYLAVDRALRDYVTDAGARLRGRRISAAATLSGVWPSA